MRELSDELARAREELRKQAEELEAEIEADARWTRFRVWVEDLVKEHGPELIRAVLERAVPRLLERLK